MGERIHTYIYPPPKQAKRTSLVRCDTQHVTVHSVGFQQGRKKNRLVETAEAPAATVWNSSVSVNLCRMLASIMNWTSEKARSNTPLKHAGEDKNKSGVGRKT